MKILVTGGAGFIGSSFVRLALQTGSFEIANLDKLTYAGNLENLASVSNNPRYHFIKGDICDSELVARTFREFRPDAIVQFCGGIARGPQHILTATGLQPAAYPVRPLLGEGSLKR